MNAIRKAMIEQFLQWKLPQGFSPDNGITFAPGHKAPSSPHWPVGTNLLTAEQTGEMVDFMLAGVATQFGDKLFVLPAVPPTVLPAPMSFHVQELRPEVLAFALLMEQRLREKDAEWGQGWKRKADTDLTVNICTAARQIEQSIFPHKGERSIKALVDMSNHCMMLADVLGALECGANDNGGPGWAALDQVQMS